MSLSRLFNKYSLVLLGRTQGDVACWGRCHSMPITSPYSIRLSSAEEVELHRRVGKYTLPYFQVQRAMMILTL